MNKFYTLIAAALVLGSTAFANEPVKVPSLEERISAANEANAKAMVEADQKLQARNAEKMRRSGLTFWQARAEDGQGVVDGMQYAGGKTVQGLATVDGYVGAGVAYPVNLITGGAFALAEGSKSYAAKAWDNEPTQVAVAPETK
jgi:hypothetical protein